MAARFNLALSMTAALTGTSGAAAIAILAYNCGFLPDGAS
jgi:hypothetical protein